VLLAATIPGSSTQALGWTRPQEMVLPTATLDVAGGAAIVTFCPGTKVGGNQTGGATTPGMHDPDNCGGGCSVTLHVLPTRMWGSPGTAWSA